MTLYYNAIMRFWEVRDTIPSKYIKNREVAICNPERHDDNDEQFDQEVAECQVEFVSQKEIDRLTKELPVHPDVADFFHR